MEGDRVLTMMWTVVRSLARHPRLWPTAFAQFLVLVPPRWWRRRPWLPVPDVAYLRFRMVTAYGGSGDARATSEDVIAYLQWCRSMRVLSSGG
ncbi:MAG: hypothetical protein M9952_06660 [Microthrixaceae bacterium]|nr:hypothetical protein [Microthrixaceae bacterium]